MNSQGSPLNRVARWTAIGFAVAATAGICSCKGNSAGPSSVVDGARDADAGPADGSAVEVDTDTSVTPDAVAQDAADDTADAPAPPPVYATTIRLMNVGTSPLSITQRRSGPSACAYGFIISGGGLPSRTRMANLDLPDSICACDTCHSTTTQPLACETAAPICDQPVSLAPGATFDHSWNGEIVFSGPPPTGSDCPATACDQVGGVPAGRYQFSITQPGMSGSDDVTYRTEADLPAADGVIVIPVGAD